METEDFPQPNQPSVRYRESENCYYPLLKELQQHFPKRVAVNERAFEMSGRWSEIAEGRPVLVEIGCNAGHVLVERAAQYPHQYFVGIEWKYKALYRAAQKAFKKGLTNVTFLRADANHLNQMTTGGEWSELDLYFPDPWPKRAHAAKRLFQPARWEEWNTYLKPEGVLHFKTDQRTYFDWVGESFQAVRSQWEVLQWTWDRHAGNPEAHRLMCPEVTLFEKLFIQKKIPICELRCKKKLDLL